MTIFPTSFLEVSYSTDYPIINFLLMKNKFSQSWEYKCCNGKYMDFWKLKDLLLDSDFTLYQL